jgi:hypothetical protein
VGRSWWVKRRIGEEEEEEEEEKEEKAEKRALSFNLASGCPSEKYSYWYMHM